MNIRIIKAGIRYLDDCEEALINSELGKRYFSKEGWGREHLEEGFAKKEIYVAIEDDKCLGFVWLKEKGVFDAFPYVYIISVKEESRGKGIGKLLLNFVEEVYFEKYSKLFLVVGDFNPQAKRLYESLGYSSIGDIKDLYREGITETLMMKAK